MIAQNAPEKHWVLIEGPQLGDALFLGRWLLAAANADKLIQQIRELDIDFMKKIERLEVMYAVEFSPMATKCIELLMTDLTAFPLSVLAEWGEMFVVMAGLGFFTRTGDRYQMTVPKGFGSAEIKSVLQNLANTEDEDYFLHPERLAYCLCRRDVIAWHARLKRLPYLARVADRAILLGDDA